KDLAKVEQNRQAFSQKLESERAVIDIIAPAKSYFANKYGLYNMMGNVAEMIHESARTKGGSWNNTAEYLWINSKSDAYKGISHATPYVGFRPIVVEEK